MHDAHFRSTGEFGPADEAASRSDDRQHADGLRQDVSRNRGSALRHGVTRLDGILPATIRQDDAFQSLSRGGEHPSRTGRPDGGTVGEFGCASRAGGPDFARHVPPGGYTWWYLDATSDDSRHAITIIAFIGSVFSPYYKFAGRRSPRDHVAMNVAVYGPAASRWAMTERREAALETGSAAIRIGPSWMSWNGDTLDVWLDEICCPRPHRVRGRIRLHAGAQTQDRFALDRLGRHTWQPLLTSARIEVELNHPSLRWTGSGYLDTNFGSEPLEAAFRSWNWSRSAVTSGTVVQYDVVPRRGQPESLTLKIDHTGAHSPLDLPRSSKLATTTIWRIPRSARSDASGGVEVTRTLEDTPFYSRSLLSSDVLGERACTVHESLELGRFTNPFVQFMLGFRMPRRWI